LAVLHGGGDFRAAYRELGKAIREAFAVRRVLDGLPPGDANERALAEPCLPPKWLALLDEQGGITTFIEAATQALGGELHTKEASEVADKVIEETIERLRAEGIAAQYDAAKGLLYGLGPVDHERVGLILRSYVRELARQSPSPRRSASQRYSRSHEHDRRAPLRQVILDASGRTETYRDSTQGRSNSTLYCLAKEGMLSE
jgi:hypothetical protein